MSGAFILIKMWNISSLFKSNNLLFKRFYDVFQVKYLLTLYIKCDIMYERLKEASNLENPHTSNWRKVMKLNQVIGGVLICLIFWIVWKYVKIPFLGVGGLTEMFVPALISLGITYFLATLSGIIRIVSELSAALAVDQITGKLRIIGTGLQVFVPWEKISGNEFTLETKSQDFVGKFETKDGTSYEIKVTVTIIPDTTTDGALEIFNSLGSDPIEQAFRIYGPATGEVVQTFVAQTTDQNIRTQSGKIKAKLKQRLEVGRSVVEGQTGTKLVAIGVGVINPDQATRDNLDLERRLDIQTKRAQKMVAAAGVNAQGVPNLSFEKALDRVQIADKGSKASAVNVRGNARGFFDFDNRM